MTRRRLIDRAAAFVDWVVGPVLTITLLILIGFIAGAVAL